MSEHTYLQPGDAAPDFRAKDQDGNSVSLNSLKGKKVILYFYPKDNTPGCTKESCNLRDNYEDLKNRGFEVIGVSPDSEKSHQKFISKFELPFTLLADVENEVINDYKVWGAKKMYGKEYMGLLRTTYIIDEKGVIAHVIPKVKTAAHSEQILTELGLN